MAIRNDEYWANRFEMLEDAQRKKAERFTKEVEKIYANTLKSIEKDIDTWFARLARNNGVSVDEAKKLLNARELREFHYTVEEYIEKAKENAVNQKWMRQLENASARVHISRLQMLQLQIQQHLQIWAAEYNKEFTDFIKEQYDYQYYHVGYELAVGANVGVAYSAIDSVRLEKLLSKPWATDGYTFSTRIWRDRDKFINELYLELGRALARGEGPERPVTRLYKEFGSENSRYQIRRVVITESVFFYSTAQKDAFDELEVEEYKYVATLDRKTSNICQDFDGKVFPLSEYQAGLTAPPLHPFCRSVTIPHFEGSAGKRFARNGEGDRIKVPSSTTYKEWYDKFVK